MKNLIKFASGSNFAVLIPEGAKGDMCRAVQDDAEFGKLFLSGPNPTMLRRCENIPRDKFPVTDELVKGHLQRSRNLQEEARVSLPPTPFTGVYFVENFDCYVSSLQQIKIERDEYLK